MNIKASPSFASTPFFILPHERKVNCLRAINPVLLCCDETKFFNCRADIQSGAKATLESDRDATAGEKKNDIHLLQSNKVILFSSEFIMAHYKAWFVVVVRVKVQRWNILEVYSALGKGGMEGYRLSKATLALKCS